MMGGAMSSAVNSAPVTHDSHLATVWERIADAIPDETALVNGGRRVTWGEFEQRASRLAAAFTAAGLGPGSKIAIDLYNCTEWLEAFFAAIKIRAVPANVNYRYLDQELRHLLSDSHAEAIVFHASLGERVMRLRQELPQIRYYVQVDEGARTPVRGSEGASAPLHAGVQDFEALIARNAPAPRIERRLDDTFLSYTGGTTGLPKGVMVQLGRAFGSLAFLGPMLGLGPTQTADPVGTAGALAKKNQRLVALPASPLMHSTGFQMTALPMLSFGGCLVTLTSRSFDAVELLDTVERDRVTLVAIVGDALARPVLNALRDARERGRNYDLASLKLITSAGVAWSGETKNGLFEFLPQTAFLDACGASEGCTYGFRIYRKGDKASGTSFTPAPGLLLLDETGKPQQPAPGVSGILAATSTATGYYNDAAKTARTYRDIGGQWYVVPGDHGRIEADGSLTLLGRGSTTINTGGEKVHPEEVEDVIKGLAGVDDCIVFGMPDERWGQRVTALVQKHAGSALDSDAVTNHARSKLAGYKVPKEVLFVDKVPRAPNGKADYPRAKELAARHAR